jgi:hypothetical protein
MCDEDCSIARLRAKDLVVARDAERPFLTRESQPDLIRCSNRILKLGYDVLLHDSAARLVHLEIHHLKSRSAVNIFDVLE